jgi:hypothetical protein
MPCWVVPTVAAEIWGMSVDQILMKIDAGELDVRHERGWMFVDVAPGGEVITPVRRLPRSERPRTYTVVAEDDGDCDPEPEVSTFSDWRKGRQRTARIRLAPAKFAEV